MDAGLTPGSSDESCDYHVGACIGTVPRSPSAPLLSDRSRVAVLVAHGMGQQIPFQALDQIAEGLRQHGKQCGKPEASAVKHGDKRYSRVSLRLQARPSEADRSPDGVLLDIYEAYWAPLTEGRITTRDVLSFLFTGLHNGLRNGKRKFSRIVMGTRQHFKPSPMATLYLFLALVVAVSLLLMNAMIVLVAIARPSIGPVFPWLGNPFFRDLTTTFGVVVVFMGAFVLTLSAAMALRQYWLRDGVPRNRCLFLGMHLANRISAAMMYAAVASTALGAVSLAGMLYVHWVSAAGEASVWHHFFSPQVVTAFTHFVVPSVLLAAAAAAVVARRPAHPTDKNTLSTGASGGTLLLIFAAIATAVLVGRIIGVPDRYAPALDIVGAALPWLVLLWASSYVRMFLVEYFGDAAIYVQPHRLDRYFELRDDIRRRVEDTARAVYSMTFEDGRVYDRIVVVGHSLGSVVAYDVLNRLILDDEAEGHRTEVVARTALFLSYGSPLDKTAFVFSAQGAHTAQARETLAASVQPLIRDCGSRPRWVNIHSPRDVISDALRFYDATGPNPPSACAVKNMVDRRAVTLFAAHVEYAQNPLLYRVILRSLGLARASGRRPCGASRQRLPPAEILGKRPRG